MTNLYAELEIRRRDFYKFVRETFPDFVDGWFYEDLCKRLQKFMQDVRDKKSPRLILCVPPRLAKSQICSVRFPIYALLNNPAWEVIVASYSQSLVNKFSRFARLLTEAHPYIKKFWPFAKIAQDHAAIEEWKIETEGQDLFRFGGTYRAVGKGASITGAGANILVCDDTVKDFEEADSLNALNNLWDWYTSTARTRLAPGGGVLVVQTRWHPLDLVGRLLYEEKNTPNADKWEIVEYKAIAEQDEEHRKAGESLVPERFSAMEYLKTKASMVARWWEALYQQRPIIKGGNLFKEKSIKRYLAAPPLKSFDSIIQVWDLRFGKSQAKSSSYVCGWVLGRMEGKFYLLAEAREKWSYAESRDALKELSERYPLAIAKIIENKANGPAIESDLESQVPGILLYNPRGDKFQRAERVLPLVLAGNFYMPADELEPWAKDAVNELCAFPRGENDDRVDCLSMGLSYFIEQEQQNCEVYALN